MAKTTNELRELFLKYFEEHSHHRVRSSLLIPHQDPSLLFTNAGMVQFKDYFTGKEKPEFSRATSCQKCVRAGGKHNDLESVGFTKRHHTFFEMLGNFSFGDYFKEEAIQYAWTFLTERIGFPEDRLWASVFETDEEAYKIWTKKIGLPEDRVVRMGEKENFWSMGDTGPCGPCSEIYFDRGEAFGKESIYDGGERFLEIWNLVFMQYERFEDGSMKPLPKPSVDTGMGLERLSSLVQGVDSNYDIDSMKYILESYRKLTNLSQFSPEQEIALKVLTDHIRAVTFLISDGVQPSSEGRGYVLRRILRRAVRYGRKLGFKDSFFYRGVDFVVDQMGEAYPELKQNRSAVQKIVQFEEEKFLETLDAGLRLLQSKMGQMSKGDKLDGEVAFQLYDTFGFPLDLTEVILREHSLELDHAGFEKAMAEQRERSRSHWKGSGSRAPLEIYHRISEMKIPFEFTGYSNLEEKSAEVLAIIHKDQLVDRLQALAEAYVVVNPCPFYAESGGQVGDQGVLRNSNLEFRVKDTQKPLGSFHVLEGELIRGELQKSQKLEAIVDRDLRMRTRINHTMTHVLHAALQEVLGEHIKQAGSLVHPDYLRFDFSHFKALTDEEIKKIEDYCNAKIRENPKISISTETLESALKSGAKAFFEDKYGNQVRVLRVGDFSVELCGGTHAESLSEAGLFKITSESSVASGVRRIVAVTGQKAIEYIREEEQLLSELSELLKAPQKELLVRVEKLLKERAELQKKLQSKGSSTKSAKEAVIEISGLPTIIEIVDVDHPKDLRPLADDYKNQIKKGVVILGAAHEGKATVVISVSKEIAEDFQTKNFVDQLARQLEGKGGGRPDFAQVGGSNLNFLTKDNLENLLRDYLSKLKLTA